jgi:glucose-6-phosphate isomerase
MLIAEATYKAKGLSFAKAACAVTGENSELDLYASKGGWLSRFPMFDWVGGRTSELSAVGLLPAALQGIDIDTLLRGAAEMDIETRKASFEENPAARLALMWWQAVAGKGAKDMVVLPYNDRLELFSKYLQQLVMESLGKERNLAGEVVNQGIAVYGNKGSTDQHAYVQQLRDGVNNFFAVFIRVLSNRSSTAEAANDFDPISFEVEPGVTSGDYLSGFFQGTRQALYENNRESITLTINSVSAYSVGQLIALFERTVGFYASLVGINAYHQPGVEAGKKAATSVLSIQAEVLNFLKEQGKQQNLDQIAAALGEDKVETIFLTLQHLSANGRVSASAGSSSFDQSYTLAK